MYMYFATVTTTIFTINYTNDSPAWSIAQNLHIIVPFENYLKTQKVQKSLTVAALHTIDLNYYN